MKDDKILNDELMSEDELDNVVGGSFSQLATDSAFLHIYGLCSEYSTAELVFDWSNDKKEAIKAAWNKAGIGVVFSEFGDNKYYLIAEISREQAYLHVLKRLGDPMTAMLKRQELLKN